MFDVENFLHDTVRNKGPSIDWEGSHHANHIALEKALKA
jgi:hypothetical protein